MKEKYLNWLIGLFMLIAEIVSAQSSNTRYWVAFTDKNNSPYSVGNPQQFLSQRAINRRVLHGYPVNTQDLPVNPSYVSQVRSTGAEILNRSRWFNGVVVRITNPAQINAIIALPFVLSTKSVAMTKAKSKYEVVPVPGNARNAQQLSTNRFDYGQGYDQISLLNGICLHNQFYDGAGMEIAEIDEGFQRADSIAVFDTLWAQHRVLGKHDFFTGDTNDLFNIGIGHGTSVLSCMAAMNSGSFIGTAPYAKYYLLRSEVDSSEQIIEEYNWVAAIEYADSAGADIATSSLGYTTFDDPTNDHTWTDLDGKHSVASLSATMAARRGMIVCVAAGNEGSGAWRKITIPSDADSILCVGATDNFGNYAPFSSQGYSADGRVKPDVMSEGWGATVVYWSNGAVIQSNGTSFATPILAGMTACLWQANPTKKNMEVIAAIKQSASQYASPDSLLGYGIPDYCLADQILKNGFGINDANALQFSENGLFVSGLEECSLNIELYDISGRQLSVSQQKIGRMQKTKLSVPGYEAAPTGTYLLKVTSDKGYRWNTKLVKLN